MAYPGGKNGAGIYQTIINRMPPHQVYVEPFLGGGAIMRLKRPAKLNIGIDLDSAVIARFRESAGKLAISGENRGRARFSFQCRDALEFLRTFAFTGKELVYCDPPYVHSTRKRKDLYSFEMSDGQHAELLRIIQSLPTRIMISGYWTRLYARELASWHAISFQAVTRSGRMATEWLWSNFSEPVALHDYRYLGTNFRERERIKRKMTRWTFRLKRMPVLERRALLHALELTSPNP